MGVGIAAASIMMPVPRILIILTDGVTPWPETVSQKIDKVIVCLTIKESKSEVPDWAQVVIIEEDS
jgi:hypothetical protein